ncbi:MAG: hypothetical protein NUW22_14615 [Acidobacteria bacterium]|nr:hypothetical protein [Acidobacteriota bacterium]
MTAGIQRAKRAYLAVEKIDKAGRPYIGQDEIVVSHGLYSAREAERELQRAADSAEGKVVDTVVETYGRENPEIAGNPRRGTDSTMWGFRGAGWLPESPRIAAINARREQDESPESDTSRV